MAEILNYLSGLLRNPSIDFFVGAFIAFLADQVTHFLGSLYRKYSALRISQDEYGGDNN